MTLLSRIRNWWRGYSDDDLVYAIECKLHLGPHDYWPVTEGQLKALRSLAGAA